MKNFLLAFLIFLAMMLSALMGAYIGGSLVSSQLKKAEPPKVEVSHLTTPEASNNTIMLSSSEISTTITDVVEMVEPAVVTVVGTVPGRQTFSVGGFDFTI